MTDSALKARVYTLIRERSSGIDYSQIVPGVDDEFVSSLVKRTLHKVDEIVDDIERDILERVVEKFEATLHNPRMPAEIAVSRQFERYAEEKNLGPVTAHKHVFANLYKARMTPPTEPYPED